MGKSQTAALWILVVVAAAAVFGPYLPLPLPHAGRYQMVVDGVAGGSRSVLDTMTGDLWYAPPTRYGSDWYWVGSAGRAARHTSRQVSQGATSPNTEEQDRLLTEATRRAASRARR